MRKIWSTDEIQLLYQKFSCSTSDQLESFFPDRTLTAVKLMGNKLGLHLYQDIPRPAIEGDLFVLLNETLITYYWIGFLMADGYIHNKRRLHLNLSIKDKDHLKSFANYINCNNIHNTKISTYISIMDSKIVPKIIEKFDFKPRKTYNPPNLNIVDDNKFLAFFIGFIDGDGCISKQSNDTKSKKPRKATKITIKLHSSWLNVLQALRNRLCDIFNINIANPHINNKGYAVICFAQQNLLLELKEFAVLHNLPILTRKWNNIDIQYIKNNLATQKNAKQLYQQVVELLQIKSIKEICEQLNLTYNYVSYVKRKQFI